MAIRVGRDRPVSLLLQNIICAYSVSIVMGYAGSAEHGTCSYSHASTIGEGDAGRDTTAFALDSSMPCIHVYRDGHKSDDAPASSRTHSESALNTIVVRSGPNS